MLSPALGAGIRAPVSFRDERLQRGRLRPCCMDNPFRYQQIKAHAWLIFCSNSANFANFSAIAIESHFGEAVGS
jgi:hypothetical protein